MGHVTGKTQDIVTVWPGACGKTVEAQRGVESGVQDCRAALHDNSDSVLASLFVVLVGGTLTTRRKGDACHVLDGHGVGMVVLEVAIGDVGDRDLAGYGDGELVSFPRRTLRGLLVVLEESGSLQRKQIGGSEYGVVAVQGVIELEGEQAEKPNQFFCLIPCLLHIYKSKNQYPPVSVR